MTETGDQWVVVLLNLDQCEEYDNTRCVMEAHGPYSHVDARAALATFPDAFAPHLVLLSP